jgi:hypothetical protein
LGRKDFLCWVQKVLTTKENKDYLEFFKLKKTKLLFVKKNSIKTQPWWYMTIIPTLRSQSQKDGVFQASLGSIVSTRSG